MKVLIAEDDPVTRQKLTSFLTDWGFDVVSTDNGLDAMDVLESSSPPEMALLDWEMPGLLGIEVCEKARMNEDIMNLYIMMITSRGRKEDMIKGFEAGVDDYLSKPFDKEELRARIKVGERIVSLEKELVNRAKDAEGKYQGILDTSLGGIIQIEPRDDDLHLGTTKLIGANPKACYLLGYLTNDLLECNLADIVHEADREKVEMILRSIRSGESDHTSFETRLIREDRSVLWAKVSFNELIGPGTGSSVIVLTVEDITNSKLSHIEIMKKALNYKLEEGNVYLVSEKIPSVSIEGFTDLLYVGYEGLAISRRSEESFRKMADGFYRYLWLSGKEFPGSLNPNLEEIGQTIDGLPQKEAVFIDRLDYLISKTSFKEVLSFVQDLKDNMVMKESVAFITVDPAILEKKQLAYLSNECSEMEPYFKSNISEDLYEILKVVQRKGVMHVDATLQGIEGELGISRPTVRKRVNQLVSFGYLIEVKKGREKTYFLSEKGKISIEG